MAADPLLAFVSTRRIGGLTRTITQHEEAQTATLDQVEQLEIRNAILQIISRSVDVPLAFQALAQRIVRLVPCDRVGLALLSDDGKEFQTYTARVNLVERRARPRPDVVFKVGPHGPRRGRAFARAADHQRHQRRGGRLYRYQRAAFAALGSALMLPLVAKGRAVGTLNVVSRQTGAFNQQHVDALLPVAEIFAVAYVAQHLQVAMGKYQTMEAMSELTLSIGAESTARCRQSSATATCSSADIPTPISSAISPPSFIRRNELPTCSIACVQQRRTVSRRWRTP